MRPHEPDRPGEPDPGKPRRPEPDRLDGPSPPVETKVIAATVASFAAAIATAILNAAVGDSELLGVLPAWLQFLVVTAAPPLLTVIASYEAPHTPRPPLMPPKRRHPSTGPLDD